MSFHTTRTVIAVLVLTSAAASLKAQEPGSTPSFAEPVQRIRQALQQPTTRTGENFFVPTMLETFHLGILTFTEPNIPGEFVSVGVPIGDLVSRVAHSMAAAQYRRAEKAAHDEVAEVVAELQKATTK